MHKLLTKYSLAAHLALLAVAPLFLSPWCGEGMVAATLLYLSAAAAVWMVMAPSIRAGEHLDLARRRIAMAIMHDPLFWASLAMVGFCGLRALNDGVRMAYDAETMVWVLSKPPVSFLPGAVEGAGDLPFAVMVALTVLLQALRHALGKAARIAFLFVAATLAGVAGLTVVAGLSLQNASLLAAATVPTAASTSAAPAFGAFLLAGTVALVGAFERRWYRALILIILGLAGSVAGFCIFATPLMLLAFAVAEVLAIGYALFFTGKALSGAGTFRYLLVLAVSLTMGVLLSLSAFTEELLELKTAVFTTGEFLGEEFLQLRTQLGRLSLAIWQDGIWCGTGVGSYAMALRFTATAEDWLTLPPFQVSALNGWWQLLAERGLVGLVVFVCPAGWLLFTYIRRLVRTFKVSLLPHPMCWLGPLALVALGAISAFDCSLLRADAVLAVVPLLAVSANSFPRSKSPNGHTLHG